MPDRLQEVPRIAERVQRDVHAFEHARATMRSILGNDGNNAASPNGQLMEAFGSQKLRNYR